MDPINIQMIIDGCLVNNQQARALLYEQVYATALPKAVTYSGNDADADLVIENAFLYVLDNLSFFDSTKLGFKSWVIQVVTDIGIDTISSQARAVYALQAIEGFNQADISKRMGISFSEVQRLLNESGGINTIENAHVAIDPSRVEASWARILPVIRTRFISDETVSMPFRAMARQRITDGGWIGWSILIGLSAIAMVILHFSGVIPGKKFAVRTPPVNHISSGLGFALPCPNH